MGGLKYKKYMKLILYEYKKFYNRRTRKLLNLTKIYYLLSYFIHLLFQSHPNKCNHTKERKTFWPIAIFSLVSCLNIIITKPKT